MRLEVCRSESVFRALSHHARSVPAWTIGEKKEQALTTDESRERLRKRVEATLGVGRCHDACYDIAMVQIGVGDVVKHVGDRAGGRGEGEMHASRSKRTYPARHDAGQCDDETEDSYRIADGYVDEARSFLDLEAARLSATAGLLELAALGTNIGLGVVVGAHVEVLHGLARVLGTAEEDGVAALGRTQGELVEGQALAAGSQDPGTGGLGEAQSGDRQLGQLQETVVIGDATDDDDRLGRLATGRDTTAVLRQVYQARHADRRTVDLGHEQTAQDDLVEARVSAAGQEAIELAK